MTVATVKLVLSAEDMIDVILSLLSVGFILELDEVVAKLLHYKVKVKNNLSPHKDKDDTLGDLKIRRINRRCAVGLAIFLGAVIICSTMVGVIYSWS
jgi:hypothetical protein